MSWTSRFAALLLAAVPMGLLADGLVVRADGPSASHYPLGHKLVDGTHISLVRGDQLVVLDAGGTRTLSGPGTYVIGAAVSRPANQTVFASLAGAASARRARIGAVRSLDGINARPTRRPNIWFVDTGTAGPVCIVDTGTVALWRSASDDVAQLTVSDDSGESAKLAWIKGQDVHPWPATLPVVPGHRYTLAAGGAQTTVSFRVLPVVPADLSALGGALATNGCKGQLDVLIATSEAQPAG